MVDMAFGLCGNYFMERVQAKQVKQCFGCSAAAGFIDIKHIFFCEFKNVLWGKGFKHTTCLKKKGQPRMGRKRKTLTKTDWATQCLAYSQVKQMTWCTVDDYCILVTQNTNKEVEKKNMNRNHSQTESFFSPQQERWQQWRIFFTPHKAR